MKVLRTLLLGGSLLAAGLMAVGFFLPTGFDWQASIDVAAPPEAVHRIAGDLERWPDWTPFREHDPSLVTHHGEQTTGVGAQQRWEAGSGSGSLTITESDPQRGLRYTLWFEQDPSRPLQGALRYERIGDKTRVTWGFHGDLGGRPFGGYFVRLLRPVMHQLFDRGLERLKVLVETEQRALSLGLRSPPAISAAHE